MIDFLKESFEHQADWRREKAREYPDDAERNLDAARVFDRLAASCKDVSPKWADAYEKLAEDDGGNMRVADQAGDMMGSINIAYDSAEEFIKDLVERVAARA